jgi:hypothetical protein
MADSVDDYLNSALKTPTSSAREEVQTSVSPSLSPSQNSGGSVDDYLNSALSPKQNSPVSNPENGNPNPEAHDESDRFTQDDPNDNWLEKGWHTANKPLTESLLGWGQYRQGAGGLERGVEKVLSGLTSPLSLVTMAAFAPAGIVGSVGGSLLKEGLMEEGGAILGEAMDAANAGATVEKYAGAVSAATKARVAGQSINEAVTNAGMTPTNFEKMGEFLRSNGLQESDLLKEGTVRRVAAQGLYKAGMSAQGAVSIAKGAETLVNAGFAAQQIQGAVYSLPRFADLMEHGQYDEASEYLVTGGASALFGALGAAHSLKSIDTLVPGLNEKNNLPLTQGTQNIMNVVKARDAAMNAGVVKFNTLSKALQRSMFNLAGVEVPESLQEDGTFLGAVGGSIKNVVDKVLHKNPVDSPELAATRKVVNFFMQAGGDTNRLFQEGRALAEAMGEQDKWDEFTKDYARPTRTVDHIVDDQKSDYLLTKRAIETRQDQIKELQDRVSETSASLKRASSPSSIASLSASLSDFSTRLQEAQKFQEANEVKLEGLKKWEGSPEEALKAHHQELVKTFYEMRAKQLPTEPSPESGTALDEFNTRANVMGHAAHDAQVIQEAHPEWFEGSQGIIKGYHGTPAKFEGMPDAAGLGTHVTPDKALAERFANESGEYAKSGREPGRVIEMNLGLKNPLRIEDHGFPHSNAIATITDFEKQGVIPKDLLGTKEEITKRITDRAVEIYGGPEGLKGMNKKELGDTLTRSYQQAHNEELIKVKEYLKSKGYDGLVYKNELENGGKDNYVVFDRNQMHEPIKTIPTEDLEGYVGKNQPTWEEGPRHPKLPDDLEEMVEKSKGVFAKMKADHPEEYQHRLDILKGYADAARGVSPEVQAIVDRLRQADDDIWSAGSNNDLIHGYIENHLFRQWGDDTKVGNVLRTEAKAGNFATNVIQARHRFYQIPLEGFLSGKRMLNYDPVEAVRKNGIWVAEAAANRKVVDAFLKSDLRTPRGMPLFILKGSGSVPPGVDGQSSAVLINPDKVRSVLIKPEELQTLKANGTLDQLLQTREIVNLTPQVSLDSIPEWINSTKKQLFKMEQSNQLLGEGTQAIKRHREAWGQLGTFVKEKAGRSAKFIRSELEAAKRNNGVPTRTDLPADVALGNYATKLLTSGERLRPRAIQDLEALAERFETQAEGASSSRLWDDPKEGSIRPSEVSSLLRLNQKFLPPELKAYLDEQHDKLVHDDKGGPVREQDGSWGAKGLTKTMRAVEDAANNARHSQLTLDLLDLQKIDNEYSSINPITQANNRPAAEDLLKEINSRQPERYQFSPKPGDYKEIDHPAFQNWNWMAAAPDGSPILAKSGVMVDKSIHAYIVNRLGLEGSALRKSEGIGKLAAPILGAGSQAKSLLLSGSPFHIIQEMLRGVMLGVNPFVRPNTVADLSVAYKTVRGDLPIYKLAARNGFDFTASKERMGYTEGLASHSKLVSKIPIWGPVSDEIHSFLFDRMIPGLKASGFRKMFDQYAEAHPEWTDDAVAEHAAKHVNNAFGGQNWREMGRSATTQDWFNLVALAPDWLESEMRFASGIMNNAGLGAGKYKEEEGKNFSRQQVATMAAGIYVTARVLNGLYSGDPHYDTPFGLAAKDKDGRTIEFGVRTLPGDILHMSSDPWGFITGRESPFLRMGQELVTGRNQFGQKLTDGEKFVDAASQFAPIPGQSILKKVTGLATGTDVGMGEQIAKAAGATASVNRTPAQQKAANLAAERSESGAMTPQKVAHHRVVMKLEDDLRSGRITNKDLTDMADYGSLSADDAKAVLKNVKDTVGLDPEAAKMYSRVSRLDLSSAYDIYDTANPSEKAALHKLVLKKAQEYIKKSRTSMTGQERAQDPLFARARRAIDLDEAQRENKE